MSQPFLGQLQMYSFGFAPRGWAQCNGQTMPIQQYSALFALLGVTYGGNGSTNFNLPNLQSRVPMHYGTSPTGTPYTIGEFAGEENVSLTIATMPGHTHTFNGSSANGTATIPASGSLLAKASLPSGTPDSFYGTPTALVSLNPASVGPFGSNLPHSNIQPYLTINWCIALTGIFPSRN